MRVKTLKDVDLRGKRVFIRADLNVPLDGTTITDDGRLVASAPTLKKLSEAGARVVVVAHLGRPKGEPDPQYSLEPLVGRLSELVGREVAFAGDTVGEKASHGPQPLHGDQGNPVGQFGRRDPAIPGLIDHRLRTGGKRLIFERPDRDDVVTLDALRAAHEGTLPALFG